MKNVTSFPKVDKERMSRVAVKLFFRICEEWNLNDEQSCILAGVEAPTTLDGWRVRIEAKEPVVLSSDILERLSYIAGIYKGIQNLFSESTQWEDWVHKPNRDFGDRSALDHMLCGRITDLADVRRYLDAWSEDNYA